MTRRRPGRFVVALQAVGALSALGVVLLGLPLVLARQVGWPLPRAVPEWGEIRDALGGASVSDDVVIRTLTCAAWILWALVLVCFAAEASAWLRGREARRLPVAGLLQPAIRELVISATMLIGLFRPTASTPLVIQPTAPALVSFVAPTPVEGLAILSGSTAAAPSRPSCIVAPRDSLWKLAERHLGDGMRWREIWELNSGRTLADDEVFNDPNLIRPGWSLFMPADAVGLDAVSEQPSGKSTVVPSEPAVAPAPSEGPDPTGAPRRSTAPGRTTSGATASDTSPTNRDDPDYEVAPVLGAAALVSAGVIATLSRLRRRQQRHRRPGHMIRLPSPEVARTEVHLRRAAVAAPFDRLDSALRVLAHQLGRREDGPCPAIAVLSVGPQIIEIVLTEPVNAPAGLFEVTAGGRAWTLPAGVTDEDLRPLATIQSGPAPALVTVGSVDERTVMIDLETEARTLVGGEPDDATALLWCMALELATSNRADDIDLVVVGKPPAGLDALDRMRVVDSIDEVLATIEADAASMNDSLARLKLLSTFDARAADPTLLLTPTVVLVADPPPGRAVERLLAVGETLHGVAVVVAGQDIDATFDRELCVEADTVVVKPMGLRLRPAALPGDVVDDIGGLLSTAVDLEPGLPLDLDPAPSGRPPPDGLTIGPSKLPLPFDVAGNPVLPAGHVLVRLLGPIEVCGSDRPIDRRRCVELVAYLALHPEGVDEGRIMAALWPDEEPTRGAFNETVSRARRLLGLDPAGVHHLLPVDNRRYRLGPFVVTDDALVHESIEASHLIRGLPFEGTARGYEWAYAEGHAYRLSAVVDDLGDAPSRTVAS